MSMRESLSGMRVIVLGFIVLGILRAIYLGWLVDEGDQGMSATAEYRCPQCRRIVTREIMGDRPKRWRKSFCLQTGKDARLQLIKAKEH